MRAGTLELMLMADLARIKRDMDEAQGIVGNATARMSAGVDRLRSGFLALAGAYVGAQTVREFMSTADAMAAMEGRLKNVVGAGAEFEAAQRDMYRVSMQNNVALEASTTLFTRIYEPIKKMGGGVREATLMVDALSTGLRISNASQQESSSAILQFSQAMASGTLRGEEFNSVNEAAPEFLGALAAALGKSRGELREMASQGQLTADVVGNAMPAAMALLSAKAAGLPETVGGAMSDIRNETALAAQQIDRATGATAGLAETMNGGAALAREFARVMADNATQANLAGGAFDGVGVAIRVVGTIAETVLVLMSDVAFVLRGIGREAGGLAAQAVAAARFDFEAVGAIRQEMIADSVQARAELDRYQAGVMGMTDRVLQARDALRTNTTSLSENAAEMAKLARQGDAAGSAYTRLQASAVASSANIKAAADAAKRAAQEELRLVQQVARARADARDAEASGIADYMAAENARRIGEVAAARAAVRAAADEYRQYGLTRSQIAELGLARLQDKQLAFTVGSANFDSVQKEIDAQRELIEILKRGEVREAGIESARKTADEWDKVAGDIGQSLTDSLFRAFESGRGFFDTLWEGIKNTIKTTILRVVIDPVMRGISGTLSGFLGGGTAPAGTDRLSQGMDLVSRGRSLYGMGTAAFSSNTYAVGYANATGTGLDGMLQANNAFGTGTGAGGGGAGMASTAASYAAGVVAGHYAGRAISDGYSTGGSGNTMVNAGTAIGAIFAGPIGAAVGGIIGGIVNRAFGRRAPEVTDAGIEGSFGASGFGGNTFSDWHQQGGWFRSDRSGTDRGALDSTMQGFLSTSARTMLDMARSYGEVLGLPVEALTRVTTTARVTLTDNAEQNQRAIEAALAEYGDALLATYLPAVQQFARIGETVGQTLERLAGLQQFSNIINDLGGVFSRVAGLGFDARESFFAMAGGMDALLQKATSFAQNYFSREEIAGLKAREVQDALSAVGIDKDIRTREEFRALVEGLDVGTQQGREQLATLLNVGDAFASLSDYLAETDTTLAGAAAQAPEMAALGGLFVDGATAQVSATNAVQVAVLEVRDAVVQLMEQQQQAPQVGGWRGNEMYAPGRGELQTVEP